MTEPLQSGLLASPRLFTKGETDEAVAAVADRGGQIRGHRPRLQREGSTPPLPTPHSLSNHRDIGGTTEVDTAYSAEGPEAGGRAEESYSVAAGTVEIRPGPGRRRRRRSRIG